MPHPHPALRVRLPLVGVFLWLLTMVSAGAEDLPGAPPPARVARIERLLLARGLLERLREQIGAEPSTAVAARLVSAATQRSALTPEARTAIAQALSDFDRAWSAIWNDQQIAERWDRLYGAEFSDEELERLLAFYESPLAQKDRVALREAESHFQGEAQAASAERQRLATRDLTLALRRIISECNCARAPEPAR